jgi:hypothetical protein
LLEQLLSTDTEVLGYIGEDSCQRADSQRRVIRDCDMVLASLLRRETQVAPALARDLVTQRPEGAGQAASIQVARELHDRLMRR